VQVSLQAVAQLNDTWAMDVVGETLYSARWYRIPNVIDEGSREALAIAIEVDVSLPSERVVGVLRGSWRSTVRHAAFARTMARSPSPRSCAHGASGTGFGWSRFN